VPGPHPDSARRQRAQAGGRGAPRAAQSQRFDWRTTQHQQYASSDHVDVRRKAHQMIDAGR